MTPSEASLDRLHDIVEPPPIPWWPMAPGWYVVGGLVFVGVVWAALRALKNWKAAAYRREALRELEAAEDVVTMAGLIRRTALAVVPRQEVVEQAGKAWPDWLADHWDGAISPEVRELLMVGVYQKSVSAGDGEKLREFAAGWIAGHRVNHSESG